MAPLRLRTLVAVALGVPLLAAALHCGGGSKHPATSSACGDLASARCDHLASCGPGDLARRFGDLATCEDRTVLSCEADLAAPATARTPANTVACADALPSTSCSDFLNSETPGECQPIAGPRADGQACIGSSQCQSSYCQLSDGVACGVCAPVPQVGDACVDTGCGASLVCRKDTPRCAMPVANGASCDGAHPCLKGASCVGEDPSAATPGACEADIATLGSPCDSTKTTMSTCDRDLGLFCGGPAGSQTCQQATSATAGQACGRSGDANLVCVDGSTCVTPAGASAGTCVAPAADGSACDLVKGPGCLGPARCVADSSSAGMVCKVPDGAFCG